MYGLPQAGSLEHDLLKTRLNQEGYYQSKVVPGLWKHKTKSIQFVLVVDDFGIKYIKQQDLDHLIKTLQKYYDVTVDMDGKEFVKIDLDWDYKNGQVHLSMQPYLQKAVCQFDNVVPAKCHDSPIPMWNQHMGQSNSMLSTTISPLLDLKSKSTFKKLMDNFNGMDKQLTAWY